MGIETVLLLVNKECLDEILAKSWNDTYKMMEKGEMRNLRPDKLPRLNRAFDIDCEAEILDYMETIGSCEGTVREVLIDTDDGEEGLLLFMQYSSPGSWECWEARTYLYLDVGLNRKISDRNDLYAMATWEDLVDNLNNIPEAEYAEKVCIDWLDRRKTLGETLDEKEDPKIIPTYEAHTRNSTLLVHAITEWKNNDQNIGIVGREHLDAASWGHGDVNLSNYLRK